MNKYNQLIVLEEVKHNGRLMYRTQCDCGRVDLKRKDWVISGRTTSCKSCASKRTAKLHPPPVTKKGYGELSGTHFLAIKNGALRRGFSFKLSPKFLWELYEQQEGLCALTGLSLHLDRSLKKQNVNWDVISASLDRKDSSKPYTEDNVQWVHKEINRLKNNYSLEELLYWSRLLLSKHGNPEPSLSSNALEGATTRDRDSRVSNIPTSPQPQEFDIEYYKSRKYILNSMLLGEDIV
jgi:hypothetical protein